jgi:hypothetical protein
MSYRNNGQAIVVGNGSAVVDDFELIHRMPAPLTSARRQKLDSLADTIKRARTDLNVLERIKQTHITPEHAMAQVIECVEESTLVHIAEATKYHI